MSFTGSSYEQINFCTECGTKLNIQEDHEQRPRPTCPACGWKFYKNPIPASACVILNDKNEIVIIKRKFAPAAGEWALPSGYIEIDQEPSQAAEAEMNEETGLTGKVIDFLGYYSDFSPLYEKVISFGFLMKVTGGVLQAGDDASEACYVHLRDVGDLAFESHNSFVQIIKERNEL